mgnify:CR=1 FL=1
MRLVSLILALVITGGLIAYYKNSMLPVENSSGETVREQARQIIDEAKNTTDALSRQLEEQNRRLQDTDK